MTWRLKNGVRCLDEDRMSNCAHSVHLLPRVQLRLLDGSFTVSRKMQSEDGLMKAHNAEELSCLGLENII